MTRAPNIAANFFMVLSLVHFSIWQWLGAFEASVPVSAGERRTANACLEEVFRNVWTILVPSRIFQPEAKRVTKVRIWSVWAILAVLFATSAAFAPLWKTKKLPKLQKQFSSPLKPIRHLKDYL